MSTPRRNIECKASDPDPSGSLVVCRTLGAEDHGEIRQRDTYFTVPRGGLKLREEQPGRPHLIQFERVSEPQQRESRYRIAEVDDAEALRAVLTATIGATVVVCKIRRLFLWHDVRIHLDDVEQLGTFIELEAVAAADSDLSRASTGSSSSCATCSRSPTITLSPSVTPSSYESKAASKKPDDPPRMPTNASSHQYERVGYRLRTRRPISRSCG